MVSEAGSPQEIHRIFREIFFFLVNYKDRRIEAAIFDCIQFDVWIFSHRLAHVIQIFAPLQPFERLEKPAHTPEEPGGTVEEVADTPERGADMPEEPGGMVEEVADTPGELFGRPE